MASTKKRITGLPPFACFQRLTTFGAAINRNRNRFGDTPLIQISRKAEPVLTHVSAAAWEMVHCPGTSQGKDAVMEDQIAYHEERAEREMSLGLSAQSIPAARAHLELSSMHREKVRALGTGKPGSKPPLIMD